MFLGSDCHGVEGALRNAFIRNHALLPWIQDIRRYCPLLRSLWIDTRGANMTPECNRAIVMIRSLSSLTHLRLWLPVHPRLMKGLCALRWIDHLKELNLVLGDTLMGVRVSMLQSVVEAMLFISRSLSLRTLNYEGPYHRSLWVHASHSIKRGGGMHWIY